MKEYRIEQCGKIYRVAEKYKDPWTDVVSWYSVVTKVEIESLKKIQNRLRNLRKDEERKQEIRNRKWVPIEG
jgi:hypothetical protein